ncbi:23S rRNA (guanosine(2251)-2'-O)-methyltransferase RlmB [Phaeodactylibacter luteus]|uniref:23S rRNA (Guanosine(2251)-2'-O)-methyltransferase RlmB n=1 Tax=Phaeodactylibacter luteus TaxID=1564516 RepID=A0A5C6RTG8_9BACT|nr:23S rRNA (guanosine(2251)-2'-O)-methyltransferase RlmB [Phaeodactylibacter luteus]TXB65553.1 23S rRNA (guanosine(2251)-2'-O)-methyltransferase RlmB [Phaeodactylibacter luteus]
MEKRRLPDFEILFGRHPVTEALQNGVPMEKVMLQQGIRGEMEKELRHLCREAGTPLQVVPKERFKRYTKGNHQGVVAFQALIRYQRIEDILPTIYEKSESPLLILLDGVTDVRNFGAIARSAEACGAHALIIPQKNSAQINGEAIKTSAGALNLIPVCREKSLITTIEFLQASGVTVLASDLQAEKPLHELDLSRPVAFVLGAEGEGISPAVAKSADETFIIPQVGRTDSLNVSVANGMMLYEAMRQRMG